MPRETFQQELDGLVADVSELGTEVANSLESAVEAMIGRDTKVVEPELGVDAPMKPMPLATWAATREGSRMTWRSFRMSEKPKMETTMKRADPSETRAWVLIPAAHSNRSRSRPTRAPRTAATARRKTSSHGDIIARSPPNRRTFRRSRAPSFYTKAVKKSREQRRRASFLERLRGEVHSQSFQPRSEEASCLRGVSKAIAKREPSVARVFRHDLRHGCFGPAFPAVVGAGLADA